MRQDDPDRAADIIVDLVKNHIPRRFQLDPFDEIQVLSPMHKGTVGAANLNLRLQQALNPEGEALQRGERLYRLGDKVMQIRNNYEKDVYNGDIGRVSSVDVQEKCLVVRYDDRYVGYDWEELDAKVEKSLFPFQIIGFGISYRRHSVDDAALYAAAAESHLYGGDAGQASRRTGGRAPRFGDGR